MRKSLIGLALAGAAIFTTAACSTPADNADRNISEAAENFKVIRQVTVINGFTDEVLFQAVGAFSYETDGKKYTFTFKMEDGTFKRHTVLVSDNSPVIVEDLSGVENADAWVYEVYYLPEQPVSIQLEK